MTTPANPFDTLQTFAANGASHRFYSLPALEAAGAGRISRLPVSIRLVLESLLRNCDGKRVTEQAIRELAGWGAKAPRTEEIPFVVARIVLQDFTGVPLLVDLAAMRAAVARLGKDPKIIEPLVPVDLVVDHSVQVDYAGTPEAYARNLDMEFKRNRERYQFLKWGMQAFDTFKVVPPGIGIVHQVNLEYLAKGVLADSANDIYYPDTLVGTDSHTTMINGLGIVGWGVGGIEAEAGMLGQPVYFLTPDVVGVHLTGALREGVTATDLALTITQMLRKAKVVGKFVEFYGPGAAALPVVDRATIANMAPEYGATMGFFPIDAECANYLRATGRDEKQIALYEAYYRAQNLWGIPQRGDIDYSTDLELDLASVVPSVAGPKRPQDRIELPKLKEEFAAVFSKPVAEGGFGKSAEELKENEKNTGVRSQESGVGGALPRQTDSAKPEGSSPDSSLLTPDSSSLRHGSVLIAAITSCTNTSNPSVMLAAGLLAKKAVERGLKPHPAVKASLAPGSRVVSDYLAKAGLQTYLDQLGFDLVGYGCTTCIGNSGPLDAHIEDAVVKNDLVAASVLSGNRNFEARVHQNIKANFLMSPPLVVAFALAGRVDIDMSGEPIATDADGKPVYLRDLWPTLQEIRDQMQTALKPEVFRNLYTDFAAQNPKWNEIPATAGDAYTFDESSTYIQEPPFFAGFSLTPGTIAEIHGARPLGIFGDSVTTDHISPAGAIKKTSPAGKYLLDHGVAWEDFNSYGSRRGNDRIMTRGTFANVRIKNLMLGGEEGGNTLYSKTPASAPEKMSIHDAAMKYAADKTPLIVIAGQEYGTGSSRDWAAKGTNLLGVKVVVAQSFERIHRSNLVGMGVLPLQFKEGVTAQTLKLDGTETYDVLGLDGGIKPQQDLTLRITRKDGAVENVPVRCRIDTPIEIEYYQHGGILPYVLRQIVGQN
ncbi:aconitate hydratase [Ereboglobus sp. PH5-5]|uniref:aconitate hydratase AcnA n=1 Tax=Ereboglobus sp. PH5-5 TaxID=2940529 RepID=UPI0024061116|nr:aconitate hydratase AcnA [Ereboglobus sp. PH5-5]MDF9833337.1 aconitate hydratase [Ereboglobus sp. PH5-5]